MNLRYTGNLTFSIYPGLDITIPNHQLVVPDFQINSEGQEYPSNSSVVEVLINSLQAINLNDMPLFGLPFLSSAYLIVDNDKQQFTLSQSRQSTSSNLVAIGPPACTTPVPSPTSQPSPSILATPAVTPTPKASSGTPKGAIAGAVVGGLVIIAICIGLLFIIRKRLVRRRVESLPRDEKQEHMIPAAVDSSVYTTSELADKSVYTTSELAADIQHTRPPHELPLD